MNENHIKAKELLHHCDRCVRYHNARRAFFDFWNKLILASIVFLNSGAVAILITKSNTNLVAIIALIPALLLVINLVYDLANKARIHEFLSRRFHAIEILIDTDQANDDKIMEWRKQMNIIYADEPPTYHALNAVCFNDSTKALGYDRKYFHEIVWWKYFLRNWIRFSATEFPQPNLA